MKLFDQHLPTAARVLLGLIFFVFGLNGFLHFIPQPPPEGEAAAFLGALFAAGYMFPVIKGVEVLAGLALLGNRFVPLALTVLAPITVNIALFHLFLAPAGMPMVVVLLAASLYLAWVHRAAFAGVLAARSAPAAPAAAARVVLAGARASS